MRFSKFFSRVQETPWYQDFLAPVVAQIESGAHVLDIGTGSGKLMQLLIQEKSAVVAGIDSSASMLEQAELKLTGLPHTLLHVERNTTFPLEDNSFDTVTICNVLFALGEVQTQFLLDESFRVLKPGGTIVVLSPTGRRNVFKLLRTHKSWSNRSIILWYFATGRSARNSRKKQRVKQYCTSQKRHYSSFEGLNGFSLIEVLR